jgi:hypothetical protein
MNPRILPCIVSIACAAVLMPSKSSAATSLLLPSTDDATRTLSMLKDRGTGAVTLDDVYRFNFVDLGFGSLTFVARSRPLDVSSSFSQNSYTSRIPVVCGYEYDYPASVSVPGFDRAGGFGPNLSPSFSEDSVSPLPMEPVPESSTWIVGALALLILAYSQRARFLPRPPLS